MLTRFTEVYKNQAVPKLMEQFKYTNIHQVPTFEKVVINRGLGEAAQNAKSLEASLIENATIAGQKPVVTIRTATPSLNALQLGLKRSASVEKEAKFM